MLVLDHMDIATIEPEAAERAHRNFQQYYATTLDALPGLGLRWRLDVETRARESGQSPEQQHQLVVWQPELKDSYGLRLWLRQDGLLSGFTGEVLSAEILSLRIMRHRIAWEKSRTPKNG